MQAQRRLRDLAISDSGMVFDACSGAMFTINRTGRAIVDGLKSELCRSELLAELARRFALEPEDDPGRDLDEFLLLLRKSGLLPHDFTLED